MSPLEVDAMPIGMYLEFVRYQNAWIEDQKRAAKGKG